MRLIVNGSILAFHRPADMIKIADALAGKPQLSAEKMAEVKKLRAVGEALHKAGKGRKR